MEASGKRILLEAGPSVLAEMKRHGIEADSLDAIVISHLHGDHFGGIPALLLHAQFVAGRRKPLLLVGPFGLKERLQEVFDLLFPGSAAIAWDFDWRVHKSISVFVRPGKDFGNSFAATTGKGFSINGGVKVGVPTIVKGLVSGFKKVF